jgi:hypothetical protein
MYIAMAGKVYHPRLIKGFSEHSARSAAMKMLRAVDWPLAHITNADALVETGELEVSGITFTLRKV